MISQRRSSSTVITMALGTCLLALASCGDRSLGVPRADGGAAGRPSPTGSGTGGEAGGAQGSAGASGGSVGAAGSVGGSAGVTGAAGSVGGSAGTTTGTAGAGEPPCPCPAIACATGFVPTPDPLSCCPVCKPIVCNGACVVPTCGPNSHLEKAAGQCCATCMPGVNDRACTDGRKAYAASRAVLIEKYTEAGCVSDDDCALFFESPQCGATCGTVVNASLVMQAITNLDAAASIDCATCLPEFASCGNQNALCSNGKCVEGTSPTR